MVPGSSVILLLACAIASAQQPRSVDALIRAVHSKDAQQRRITLDEIATLGAEAGPTVPALVDLLTRQGRRGPDTGQAMDALTAIGAPAAPALPLLVEWTNAAGRPTGDDHSIYDTVNAIALAMGPTKLRPMLDATAHVARSAYRKTPGAGPEWVWEGLTLPRAAFNPARQQWGRAALPALRDALTDRDQYIVAEAAAWIDELDRFADEPVPWLKETLPWLSEARSKVKTAWARYELDRAIARIR